MDLQTRKITFVQEFLKIQSEEIINRLEKLLEKEKGKITENDFTPLTLDEFNERIDKSLLDSKNDRLIENINLREEIQEWS
ncbi:MAG TPA: hypothetical protein VIK10_03620 [Prolixibacteraceae bacterium]